LKHRKQFFCDCYDNTTYAQVFKNCLRWNYALTSEITFCQKNEKLMKQKNVNVKFGLKNKITEKFRKYSEFEFPQSIFWKNIGKCGRQVKTKIFLSFFVKKSLNHENTWFLQFYQKNFFAEKIHDGFKFSQLFGFFKIFRGNLSGIQTIFGRGFETHLYQKNLSPKTKIFSSLCF
jgi:hypothetical protein